MFEITKIGQYLIIAGVALFLAGLIQGVFIPFVKNSRMGLAGHLTAVQCGMALCIFGIIWSLHDLPPFWESIAAFGSVAGYSFIWLGITIASMTGASQALPIAGKGFSASRNSEIVVYTLEITGVILSLLSGATLLLGLIFR